MTRRQLLTTEDAVPAKGQHMSPCSDCPWARTALRGWLGGTGPVTEQVDDWLKEAHGGMDIPCHVLTGAQCAGAAIYRTNVCKRNVAPGVLLLPADREKVFATPMEFRAHHSGPRGVPAAGTETDEGDRDMPKAEAIARNLLKDQLKAAHEKKVAGLTAKHTKALDKATAAAKKTADGLKATLVKVDAVLAEMTKLVDDKFVASPTRARLEKLIEKADKLLDKHLAGA